jgi:hypothetical protein
MVTSLTRIALSWQETADVPASVPGGVVVDTSGVEAGVSVGTDKPGFVGGRVEVAKRAAVGADFTWETLMQEARLRVTRVNIQTFFISKFYFEQIK